MMADFGGPSFSLGLDLGFDSQTNNVDPINEVYSGFVSNSSDDEHMDINSSHVQITPPTLKRLKRGISYHPCHQRQQDPASMPTFDDDIEEFSSQEDHTRGRSSTLAHTAVCRDSKTSLSSQKVLFTPLMEKSQTQQRGPSSDSAPNGVDPGHGGAFPDLTLSPVRKIFLLHSDSDDLFLDEDSHICRSSTLDHRAGCSNSKTSLSSQNILFTPLKEKSQIQQLEPRSDSVPIGLDPGHVGAFPDLTLPPVRKVFLLDSDSDDHYPDEDRFDDAFKFGFHSKGSPQKMVDGVYKVMPNGIKADLAEESSQVKVTNVPTPAFDAFSEEYLKSVEGSSRNKDVPLSSTLSFASNCHKNEDYSWDQSSVVPPAYHYFNHSDPRIRKLVRERLPQFSPLGSANGNENSVSNLTAINYLDQFGNKGIPVCGKMEIKNSKKCANLRETILQEKLQDSRSWVNPKKGSMSVPTNAGKRRVRASNSSGGHWFTDEHGKRIYVSGSGEKLIGREAYMYYRKESGRGFKRTKKKKPASKKKLRKH